MQFLKGHWQLILVTSAIFLLWNTPVVLPLKILVIYFHEIAHGLAAVLTGGAVVEISVSILQGGHAITRGGNRFVILSSGYLGSLLLGMALLLIAVRTRWDRIALGVVGLTMLLVTALYIREVFPFVFCLVTGLAMVAVARYLSRPINDLVLRIIGLTSLIYAPYDIFDDTIARSEIRSDAFMLAEEFGGSTVLWGGLWLVLSLAAILLCLRYGFGPSSNISFGKSEPPAEKE